MSATEETPTESQQHVASAVEQRRSQHRLALILGAGAIVIGLYGWLVPSAPARWMAVLGIASLGLGSMASAISLLPQGRLRRVLEVAIGVPFGFLQLFLRLGSVIGSLFITATVLVLGLAIPFLIAIEIQPDLRHAAPQVVAYIVCTYLLFSLAYGGNSLVIPITKFFTRDKKFTNPTYYHEHLRHVAQTVRLIHFRRRAYELAILVYVMSVVEQLSGTVAFPWGWWGHLGGVALETLLTFVAFDSYLSMFHPNAAAHGTQIPSLPY